MDESTNSDGSGIGRRTAVKALGVGVAGAVGGIGVLAGSASAQVGATFRKSNPKQVVNADGQVTRYDVAVSGTFSYENFDDPAREAHIELEGSIGTGWKHVSETRVENLNDIEGTYDFSLAPTDVTEVFGDDAFSVDEDGGNAVSELQLRLTVEVTDTAGEEFSAEAENTMGLSVRNLASDVGMDAEAEGDAGGYDAHYSSLAVPSADLPEGIIDLFVDYQYTDTGDLSTVVYDVDLHPAFAEEKEPANFALGFGDADADHWTSQVIWNPGEEQSNADGFLGKTADENGDDGPSALADHFTASKDGRAIHVEVDVSEADVTFAAGGAYKFGAHAIDHENRFAALGTEPGKVWDSAMNYASSAYFLTEDVPEADE